MRETSCNFEGTNLQGNKPHSVETSKGRGKWGRDGVGEKGDESRSQRRERVGTEGTEDTGSGSSGPETTGRVGSGGVGLVGTRRGRAPGQQVSEEGDRVHQPCLESDRESG